VHRDHRPLPVKRAIRKFEQFYVRHFLAPQLAALGDGAAVMRPWCVEANGSPIEIGQNITIVATSDRKIRLSVWPRHPGNARIKIGDNVIICPGVRISAAAEILIGSNSMIAHGVYITDSDWHDIYDRIAMGEPKPVCLEQNVWVGDSAIICKGVTIGENSIVGAGAVVTASVPANCVVGGNPAKVIKQLDIREKMTTRAKMFEDPKHLVEDTLKLERWLLADNTFLKWLRVLFFPRQGD